MKMTDYRPKADRPITSSTVRFREINQLPEDIRGPSNTGIYAPIISALVHLRPGKVIEIDVPVGKVDFRINVYQALKMSKLTKGIKFHTRFNHERNKLYVWLREN
jgi:hypothetical protein